MDGEAVYYGLNALSHNVIMANRKKLKTPTACSSGCPAPVNPSRQSGSL